MNIGGFKIVDEDWDVWKLARECAAEFIGTFFLIFIGCGGVYGAQALNPNGSLDSGAILQIAFAFGIGKLKPNCTLQYMYTDTGI